jgi:hypothetical protein
VINNVLEEKRNNIANFDRPELDDRSFDCCLVFFIVLGRYTDSIQSQ